MRYLMVVPVTARSLGGERFATEGPFADHLRTLRALLADEVEEIVVAGIEMREQDYRDKASHLGVLHGPTDHVRFLPLFPDGLGRRAYWTEWWPKIMKRLVEEVGRSDIVHSGPSHDLWRPMELSALALGASLGRTTISVTDIDQRESARMMHETGRWSRRTYLTTRYLYDPLRDLQHRMIVRACDLVLLKGESLVRDYGAGRPHVRGFSDPGFEADQVVDDSFLATKLARIRDRRRPLQLAYFGRYSYYKGVHHIIDALSRAADADVHLNLMGYGDEEEALRRRVEDHALGARVTFHEPVRYGPLFFEKIRAFDLMLAAPLGCDTPRSVWDSFAAALPVLAYDTEFYTGLAQQTGAVEVIPWNDIGSLAERIRELATDRNTLATLVRSAVRTARENTQTTWLERRAMWTREVLDARRGVVRPPYPNGSDEHAQMLGA